MVAAGGVGALESEGPRGGRNGGSGGEGGPREGRRGEEPHGPRRFRTGKLVLPKSCHPGVRTPLRSGRELPSRAGRLGSSRKGREPEEKVQREGHPTPRGTGTPNGAAIRCSGTKAAGQPLRAPERGRRGARAARETKAPAGALPAAALPGRGGRAAAGGRGAGRGRRRRHSIKGRARRAGGDGAARTPPKFAACALGRGGRRARRLRAAEPHLGAVELGARDVGGAGRRAPRSPGAGRLLARAAAANCERPYLHRPPESAGDRPIRAALC